jgi:hypothetical protein
LQRFFHTIIHIQFTIAKVFDSPIGILSETRLVRGI